MKKGQLRLEDVHYHGYVVDFLSSLMVSIDSAFVITYFHNIYLKLLRNILPDNIQTICTYQYINMQSIYVH